MFHFPMLKAQGIPVGPTVVVVGMSFVSFRGRLYNGELSRSFCCPFPSKFVTCSLQGTSERLACIPAELRVKRLGFEPDYRVFEILAMYGCSATGVAGYRTVMLDRK